VRRWQSSGQIPGVLTPEFIALVQEILGEGAEGEEVDTSSINSGGKE
jgi:hypothetical protein